MAVTPGEAAKINDANEKKAIKEMEEHIDGVLNKQYLTGTEVRIESGDIQKAGSVGFTVRALEEVLNRFKAAGWHIKKKKTQERYGGSSHGYAFSAAPVSLAQLQADSLRGLTGQGVCNTAPSQWDVDNEGLPPESRR